jgi:hypothetical protein
MNGCGTVVFRVQDSRGRGPFAPGFSRQWADREFAPGMVALPTWIEEFVLPLWFGAREGSS